MGRINVFADESGNFDFSRTEGASRYFILATVSCIRYDVGDALLALRRNLAWAGLGLASEFHATTDSQAIRDRVFDTIRSHSFRIDATILEKAKAAPGERSTDEAFYGAAWREHMAAVAREIGAGDQMLLVSAALGTRRKRSAMHAAVQAAVQAASPATEVRVASWDAQSDPCPTGGGLLLLGHPQEVGDGGRAAVRLDQREDRDRARSVGRKDHPVLLKKNTSG